MSNELHIEWVRGLCPVQGEGTVCGLPFYFRSRGKGWQFAVASEPGGDPLKTWEDGGKGGGFYRSAVTHEWPHAGYISETDARLIIAACAGEYVQELGEPVKQGDCAPL